MGSLARDGPKANASGQVRPAPIDQLRGFTIAKMPPPRKTTKPTQYQMHSIGRIRPSSSQNMEDNKNTAESAKRTTVGLSVEMLGIVVILPTLSLRRRERSLDLQCDPYATMTAE